MMATRFFRATWAASVLVVLCGITSGANASIFNRPAPEQSAPVEMTPEIQAATQRVDQLKSKLDQAHRQLDAAKASLKAADAEFRAARADLEALTLRRQAEKLAEATQHGGDASQAQTPAANAPDSAGLNPGNRIDPNGIAKTSAPVPSAADQSGDYSVSDGQSAPPVQ